MEGVVHPRIFRGGWTTSEQIIAARARFEQAIPGWQRPAAYGVGRIVAGEVVFARVNVGEHFLPAVVLATVCGHTNGTGPTGSAAQC